MPSFAQPDLTETNIKMGEIQPDWLKNINSSLGGISTALSSIKISPQVNASVKVPAYVYMLAFVLIGFGVWGMLKRR